MVALIMAGGFGTRFWPQSRADMPKQFLRVVGEKSMIQLTVDRLLPLIPMERIYIVTAASQVPLVRQHLPLLPRENIIIEPFGMNTAPCIGLSIAYLRRLYSPDTSLVVLPADHVIRDVEAFHRGLALAGEVAKLGKLVTFGIVPEYPATGYGYIEAGKPISPGVLEVDRFKEKPDLKTAEAFLAQGNFYWNSGMFAWELGVISAAITALMPQMDTVLNEITAIWEKGSHEIETVYARMPKTPIDIGIMEPATNRAVIPVSLGWNDVGSWKALADLSPVDADGNSFQKAGIAFASRDNYVYSQKYTALIGVNDLCVIETPDAILVTTKERAEDVKKVVDHLKNIGEQSLL